MVQDRKNGSRRLMIVVSFALAALGAGPVGAQTQSPAVIIDIPAMSMASALTELAHETGINVLFSPDSVRGLQSMPVSARLTPADAARRLTAGTQLVVLQDSAGAIIVRKPAGQGLPGDEVHAAADAADQAGANPVAPAVAPPAGADAQEGGQPPADQQSSAQAGKAASAGAVVGLEEVIVTAQKREESLQDTPISIAVLGAEALSERGITSITDLASSAVPSLRIASLAGRTSSLIVGMRGIVPVDASQISRDPTVGIYVDGIYLGRAQGLGTEFFDVERIEVLRGPQGTLFGRNAVGGAVSIVTRKPSGVLGGQLTAGVRNLNGTYAKGHLDLPQFAGLSVKIDGVWTQHDGWVDNPLAGQSDFNEVKRWGGRLAVRWQPVDSLDVQYSFDKSRDESVGGYAQIEELLPGAPPLAPIFSLEPDRVERARAGVLLGPSIADVEGHGLGITWNLSDDVLLRSITAYREMEQSQFDNFSGSFMGFRPNGSFARASFSNVAQDQFSQELQLVGSSSRLQYVLGAFYFDEDAHDDAFATMTARFDATGSSYTIIPLPTNPVQDRVSTAHAESRALFGQVTWTPPLAGDRLHLTGGLRWTSDKKDGRLVSVRGVPSPLSFDFESDRVDPSATIAFDWTDDLNTYIRWATAYRAGGANSRSATFRSFGEEEVRSWEVGLKSDFLERRARLSIAAYRIDYGDRQADFSSPLNPSVVETINIGDDATIEGVEFDMTLRPLPQLTLNAGYAYTTGDIRPRPTRSRVSSGHPSSHSRPRMRRRRRSTTSSLRLRSAIFRYTSTPTTRMAIAPR